MEITYVNRRKDHDQVRGGFIFYLVVSAEYCGRKVTISGENEIENIAFGGKELSAQENFDFMCRVRALRHLWLGEMALYHGGMPQEILKKGLWVTAS